MLVPGLYYRGEYKRTGTSILSVKDSNHQDDARLVAHLHRGLVPGALDPSDRLSHCAAAAEGVQLFIIVQSGLLALDQLVLLQSIHLLLVRSQVSQDHPSNVRLL